MKPQRILIIDDEEDIREVARLSLETLAGWEVFTAGSAAEGLEKAAREAPDAVLLDVMMPEMDGPTVFQRMRECAATRALPVILLTAKVQAADRRRFDELGVAGVIAKPFDPLTLADEVATLLGWATAGGSLASGEFGGRSDDAISEGSELTE